MMQKANKIGAAFYVLWGGMHVMIGVMLLQKLTLGGPAAYLAAMNPAIQGNSGPLPGIESGILAQNAWNLIWFGVFALIVAIKFNWKNDRMGYWINLTVVSLADIGFVGAILIPGYMKSIEAFMGPLLWMLAVLFTTWGFLGGKKEG